MSPIEDHRPASAFEEEEDYPEEEPKKNPWKWLKGILLNILRIFRVK